MHDQEHPELRLATTEDSATRTSTVLPRRSLATARVAGAARGHRAVPAQGAAALPYSWIKPSVLAPHLGLLDDGGRSLMLSCGRERTIDTGTVVARAGDDVREILVVTRGELELKAHVRGARVTAGVLRAGGVFADIPFLLGTPTSYDAIASRETDIITLSGTSWTQVMAASPSLAMRWTTSIARRLDEDRRRLVMITSRPLVAQIAYLLLSLCEDDDSDAPVVRLSQSTLAQLLGARRQSVTRAMSVLRNSGLIQTAYAATILLDPPALRRLMGGDPLP